MVKSGCVNVMVVTFRQLCLAKRPAGRANKNAALQAAFGLEAVTLSGPPATC